MEFFGPALLRNFPLKKSDFFGIFKNVLTGFYCIIKIGSHTCAYTYVCCDIEGSHSGSAKD
jgi:hypothetical protein